MLSHLALDKWKHQVRGLRVHAKIIVPVSNKVESYETLSNALGTVAPALVKLCRDCSTFCTTDVIVETFRWLWKDHWERRIPRKVSEHNRLTKEKDKNAQNNKFLDDAYTLITKGISGNNPDYYLGWFTFLFWMPSGEIAHYITTCRYFKENSNNFMTAMKALERKKNKVNELRVL